MITQPGPKGSDAMGLRGDGERVDMEVGLDSPPVVLNHVASRDAMDEYVDEWAWARGVPWRHS